MESRGYLHGDMSGGMAGVLGTCSGCVVGIPALTLGGVVMGFDGKVGTSGVDTRRGDSGSALWLCGVRSAG